jgi:hypothetical protein
MWQPIWSPRRDVAKLISRELREFSPWTYERERLLKSPLVNAAAVGSVRCALAISIF